MDKIVAENDDPLKIAEIEKKLIKNRTKTRFNMKFI